MKYKALTEKKALFFQKKLANYLRNHRIGEDLKSKDMADFLGYTPQKYSQLESDKKPHDRFINIIDYLSLLAGLESMTLTEFVALLEGKPIDKSKTLSEMSFKKLPYRLKKMLHDISNNDGFNRLESILKIVSILSEKDNSQLESFINFFGDKNI